MARLLPHLTRELENELTLAVEESENGYPQHLNDLRDAYDHLIDDAVVSAVSEALWEGAREGRDCDREPRD
jgi:hypothetical protein